jgi:5'-3' exonuclease
MGIRGLKQWLQIQSPPTTPSWIDFQRTTVGIDILPFLYNAKKKNECIVAQIATIIEFFRSKQMEPIFFFDGKPPVEKKDVVKERTEGRALVTKEIDILTKDLVDGPDKVLVQHEIQKLQATNPTVTYIERDLIKNFLYTVGVRYVNALGEADPLLAFWSKTNVLSAVVSTDMDMLARGIEHLIMPNEDGDWVEYSLSNILKDISLRFSQFQDLCVLMGTDYTKNVRTIPVRTAYSAIRSAFTLKDAWSGLRQKESDLPLLERAKILLEGTNDTITSLLNEKEMNRWLAPGPAVESEAFKLYQTKYNLTQHLILE